MHSIDEPIKFCSNSEIMASSFKHSPPLSLSLLYVCMYGITLEQSDYFFALERSHALELIIFLVSLYF